MVKVDLITGFLGSGKTTFIKKYASWLMKQGQNIGILENDFGAVNVDMMLLHDLEGENCELEMVSGGCDKVHANIAQHADDGRIQYFSNEKADKGLIGKAHGTDDKIRVLRRKYCICEHFRLGDKAFLVCHQIKGNDGSDQEVLQEIDQVKNTGRNILQHLLHLRKNILCQVILGI